MKNYEQPALELIKFSAMDVILASWEMSNITGGQGGDLDPLNQL